VGNYHRMRKLTGIAAAASVFSATLVIGSTIADLMGATGEGMFVPIPYPLIVTLFVVVAILILLQLYLWIAMLTVCVQRKQFAWAVVVLFGLSWGAAAFYYLNHRTSSVPSTAAMGV
jgi:hypothetical protein